MPSRSIFGLLHAGAFALCALTAPGLAQSQSPAPALPTSASPSEVPRGTPAGPTTPEAPPTSITPQLVPRGPTPASKGSATVTTAPTTPEPPPASIVPEPAPAEVPLAPSTKPQSQEIEPNGSPAKPGTATTETVSVPARPIVYLKRQASYDDAFRSIKEALDKVRAAMAKAGLKPAGDPITIFTDTDDKGLKYQAAIPIAALPQGTADLGDGIAFGQSPSGKALKFQHRGPYDEMDTTYATITSYLDNKGLQTDSPYIEEYLNQLKTPDDPYLAVDIYIFIKT